MEIPVNYLAVLAGGIANMVIGFLWYGPLFGKKWADLMGWGEMTPEQVAEKKRMAMSSYAVSFLGALLMAYVLAHVLFFANAYAGSGVGAGLQGAFWMWVGFVVPITMGQVLWDGKPWMLWMINAGYFLVSLLAMGGILGYLQ